MPDETDYHAAALRALLPAIWDDSYIAIGPNSTSAPYRQSPTRSNSLTREANTAWACVADIRKAWRHSPLSDRQRQAVVLCGGLDLDYVEAGEVLGVARNSVQVTFERGLRRIADYLNE